jgi:hypothetical protein
VIVVDQIKHERRMGRIFFAMLKTILRALIHSSLASVLLLAVLITQLKAAEPLPIPEGIFPWEVRGDEARLTWRWADGGVVQFFYKLDSDLDCAATYGLIVHRGPGLGPFKKTRIAKKDKNKLIVLAGAEQYTGPASRFL